MFANIVARKENARRSFLKFVTTPAGISAEDGELILAYYLRHKLVTLSANDGQFHVKHGVFLEPNVLRNAVVAERAENPSR